MILPYWGIALIVVLSMLAGGAITLQLAHLSYAKVTKRLDTASKMQKQAQEMVKQLQIQIDNVKKTQAEASRILAAFKENLEVK